MHKWSLGTAFQAEGRDFVAKLYLMLALARNFRRGVGKLLPPRLPNCGHDSLVFNLRPAPNLFETIIMPNPFGKSASVQTTNYFNTRRFDRCRTVRALSGAPLGHVPATAVAFAARKSELWLNFITILVVMGIFLQDVITAGKLISVPSCCLSTLWPEWRDGWDELFFLHLREQNAIPHFITAALLYPIQKWKQRGENAQGV